MGSSCPVWVERWGPGQPLNSQTALLLAEVMSKMRVDVAAGNRLLFHKVWAQEMQSWRTCGYTEPFVFLRPLVCSLPDQPYKNRAQIHNTVMVCVYKPCVSMCVCTHTSVLHKYRCTSIKYNTLIQNPCTTWLATCVCPYNAPLINAALCSSPCFCMVWEKT